MKKVFTFILILGAVSAFALSQRPESSTENTVFTSYQVTHSRIADSILASGNFAFNNQVELRSEVVGKVKTIHIKEGDSVQRGDVLVELDTTAFVADVSQAQASVNIQLAQIEKLKEVQRENRRVVAQFERLHNVQIIDQDSLEKARSQLKITTIDIGSANYRLKQLQAALAQKQDALNKATFVAPISGLIVSVDIKEGETVIAGTTNIPGSSLLKVADLDSYIAEIRVDEADLINISVGQDVSVFPAATPSQPIVGVVDSVSTLAKRHTAAQGLFYKVKVKLKMVDYLFPGMSCRAELLIAQDSDSLSVPIAAIQNANNEPFVWVSKNNIAHKRSVELGMSSSIQQAITKGLVRDEVVLTGPSRALSALQHGVEINTQGG